jgi:hypothetical protein
MIGMNLNLFNRQTKLIYADKIRDYKNKNF